MTGWLSTLFSNLFFIGRKRAKRRRCLLFLTPYPLHAILFICDTLHLLEETALKGLCSFVQKYAKAAIALFFLAILLLGFATTPTYGRAWDDGGEMNILRMALKEYDMLLGADTAYSRYLQKSTLPRISESIERDHGICMYYPLFWAVCSEGMPYQTLTQIWRLHTWCIFTFGLFALYAAGRKMGFSRSVCCLGVLVMLLSPRFFAEGHYNNKDIPLMVLTLMVRWQTARLMEKPSFGRGMCFALAAGFCAATRVIGVAFVGLGGLMVIIHLIMQKRMNLRVVWVGLATIAATAVIYILLTPSFLADPFGFIQYVLKNAVGFSRWHGNVLFWGDIYAVADLHPPRQYLPTFIAITTPLWIVALLAVGCFCVLRRVWKEKLHMPADRQGAMLVTALLSWVLPLGAGMLVRMLVYNGWRHVYFLYGPMLLCLMYGLHCLFQWKLRRVLAGVMALCMVLTGVNIAVNHPYQYAYYNQLVPKENRAAIFELDYWNLSYVDALNALLAQTEGEIKVAASDRYTRSGLSMGAEYIGYDRLFVVTETDTVNQPDYILANLSYAVMGGFQADDTMTPVVTIAPYGTPMTVVYALTEGK